MPNFLKSVTFGAAVVAFATIAGSSVNAATCPPSPSGSERVFTLTPDTGSASCLLYGTGNLNGSGDDVNMLFPAPGNLVTLDKSDDNTTGAAEGALTFTPPTSGTSGTWSINTAIAAGYTSFVIAWKTGVGQLDPDWAAFSVFNALTGSWAVSGNQANSHANLYGVLDPNSGNNNPVVPLPAALPLFLSALGVFGLLGWRRKRLVAA